MGFHIKGLDIEWFRPLVGLPDRQLRSLGARRVIADAAPGYPDRIELRDAKPGEALLLVNYLHQPAMSTYRASHAIFVLEHPRHSFDRVDEVPEVRGTVYLIFRCAPAPVSAWAHLSDSRWVPKSSLQQRTAYGDCRAGLHGVGSPEPPSLESVP